MAQIVCPGCKVVVTVERDILGPYLCAKCAFTSWRNRPEPDRPYKLSENDRVFLRVNRILPEV